MRFGFSLLIGLWMLFTFSGCADLLAGLRQESREIDEEAERDRENSEDAVANYKPKTLRGLSANNVAELQPPAARAYGRRLAGRGAQLTAEARDAGEETYHRVNRGDFVDKESRENSLWDGQGQQNYLFANNRKRESGDMISADVEKELRREIQYQLWLTLPPEQRKVKRAPAGGAAENATDKVTNAAAGAAKDAAGQAAQKAAKEAGADKGMEAKAKDAAEEAAKSNMASSGKDDDLIRMEVVENMGNGMLRVLGQKRVIYKGVSRIVEVAALVNNKDVDDNNRTKSSTFLDMKAQVIQ